MAGLHNDSFAAIAVELHLAARDEARAIADATILAAKLPRAPGIDYALEQMKVRAAAIAAAHSVIKSLIPHEVACRALMARTAAKVAPAASPWWRWRKAS